MGSVLLAHAYGSLARSAAFHGGIRVVTIDGIDYFTTAEVCATLGIKPATLYAYVSRGRLRSYRQGMRRQRLYRRDQVEAMVRLGPSRDLELPDPESWNEIH